MPEPGEIAQIPGVRGRTEGYSGAGVLRDLVADDDADDETG